MKIKYLHRVVKNIRSCFVLLILSCFVAQAHAEHVDARLSKHIYQPEWERATDEELAALRGGFILPNGIHIDMSLEKFIHLNDVLIHASSIQYPGEGAVLQAGMQNMIANSVTIPEVSTYVQNALDGQHIEALTKINIEVSNVRGVMANGGSQRIFADFLAPALLR